MRAAVLSFVFAAALLAPGNVTSGAGATPESKVDSRKELIAYAESLLARESRNAFSTENFDVVSDSREGTAAGILARNFEAVFHVLGTIVPAAPGAGSTEPGKVLAYLFSSHEQYEQFATFAEGRKHARSSGVYFEGYGILAFHLEMYTQPSVRTVMIHECVHAYLDRRLRSTEQRIPSWLGEGLAEYIALSEVKDGRIRIGSYPAKTRYENPSVTRVLPSLADGRLKDARRAARHRPESLSFEYLLNADARSIEAEDRNLEFYGLAWLLVDYLRHGQPAWSEKEFPRLAAEIGAGHASVAALESVYPMTAVELERGFAQHVKEFKLPRRQPGKTQD